MPRFPTNIYTGCHLSSDRRGLTFARLEDACNPLFARKRERVEKKKRNFRFKGAARDELFRKCRCYGGILRLTSSLFLFREEERIQARNLRFIGLEITMPTPCIILSSFFLLCDWNYFSFFSPPPFSQLSTSRRVVLFFFLLFSSRFDYATLRIPFPVINP